jgi:hypothetical protein
MVICNEQADKAIQLAKVEVKVLKILRRLPKEKRWPVLNAVMALHGML